MLDRTNTSIRSSTMILASVATTSTVLMPTLLSVRQTLDDPVHLPSLKHCAPTATAESYKTISSPS